MYILKQNVGDRWRNFYWLPVEILRTLVIIRAWTYFFHCILLSVWLTFYRFRLSLISDFFFVQNLLCVCVCNKNWRWKTVNFCDFESRLFVLAIAIFLIFNPPDSYFAWARDDVSISSKLVPSRRSKFAGVLKSPAS